MPEVGHMVVCWFLVEFIKTKRPLNAICLLLVCRFTFTVLGGRLSTGAVTIEP